ncbi:hypothetical protein CR513_46436, partial [Mucuna pruriens]
MNTKSTFQVNGHKIKLFHEGPAPPVGDMDPIDGTNSTRRHTLRQSQAQSQKNNDATSTLRSRGALELFWEQVMIKWGGGSREQSKSSVSKRVE